MLRALSFTMRSKFAELRWMIGVKKMPIFRRRKALVRMKRIWLSGRLLPLYQNIQNFVQVKTSHVVPLQSTERIIHCCKCKFSVFFLLWPPSLFLFFLNSFNLVSRKRLPGFVVFVVFTSVFVCFSSIGLSSVNLW